MPSNASSARIGLGGILLSLAACAHGATSGPPRATTPADLAPNTTYAAFVSSLPAIAADATRSIAPCLVDRDAGSFPRLAADLAPAISPMPEVVADTIELARSADTVQLVSRYGVDGDAGPYVATFTHHRPTVNGLAIVVVVESETIFLRSTRRDGPRDDRMTLESAVERVREAAIASHPLVVVSASPATPLRRIVAFLDAARDVDTPFAFGVVFASTEGIARRRGTSDSATGLCESLPVVATDTPRGNLSPADVRTAIHELESAFLACASHGDARAMRRGGRLRVAIRIGEGGVAQDGCVVEDSLSDPAVRACVLDEVGRHAWPSPSPPGLVDVVFPLVIHPSTEGDHRASCDAPSPP